MQTCWTLKELDEGRLVPIMESVPWDEPRINPLLECCSSKEELVENLKKWIGDKRFSSTQYVVVETVKYSE